MIGLIRSKLQGTGFRIILWITLIVIAIAFTAPQGLHMLQKAQQDWVLNINGQTVSHQKFLRKYTNVYQQMLFIRQQYGQYADYFLQMYGMSSDPYLYAVEELTKNSLLDQAAQEVPIEVSEEYVREKLADKRFAQSTGLAEIIPQELIQPNGSINEMLLRQYLQRNRISAAEFEQSIKDALARFMLMEMVGFSSYTPEFVLKEKFRQEFSEKQFSLLKWSMKDMIKKAEKEPVSEEQLQKFYTQQSKKYTAPEKRGGIQFMFTPEAYGITISDEDVRDYYLRNKSSYISSPVTLQVNRILFKVDNESQEQDRYAVAKMIDEQLRNDPSRFADLAKQYSDDVSTAQNGGAMPSFVKGTHDRNFEQIAFSLQPGEISNIFKTKNGFEIIQLKDKQPVQYKSFKEVSNDIRAHLIQDAFKQQFAADVKKLSQAPTTEEVSAFAKKHNTIKRSEITPKAEVDYIDIRNAFTVDKGGLAYFVGPDKAVLLHVTEVEPSYLPPFEVVEQQVRQDYYAQKAQSLLMDEVQYAQKIVQEEGIESAKKKLNISLEQTDRVSLANKDSLEKLEKMGVSAHYLAPLRRIGDVAPIIADTDYAYLVRLDSIEIIDQEGYEKELPNLKKELHREQIMRGVQAFVASLREDATIELNDSTIAKIKDHTA